jgi:hypothetical protein
MTGADARSGTLDAQLRGAAGSSLYANRSLIIALKKAPFANAARISLTVSAGTSRYR